jgi:hypothetical protein
LELHVSLLTVGRLQELTFEPSLSGLSPSSSNLTHCIVKFTVPPSPSQPSNSVDQLDRPQRHLCHHLRILRRRQPRARSNSVESAVDCGWGLDFGSPNPNPCAKPAGRRANCRLAPRPSAAGRRRPRSEAAIRSPAGRLGTFRPRNERPRSEAAIRALFPWLV